MEGQVIGGRWKPLMHIFQNSLLQDVFAACGRDNYCYVRNDGMQSVDALIHFDYWVLLEQQRLHHSTHAAFLEGGKAATERFELEATSELTRAEVILIRVEDKNGEILMKDNAFLRETPQSIKGLLNKVDITTSVSDPGDGRALVSLRSEFLALYVVLTTKAPGRFSENALHLRPGEKKVR